MKASRLASLAIVSLLACARGSGELIALGADGSAPPTTNPVTLPSDGGTSDGPNRDGSIRDATADAPPEMPISLDSGLILHVPFDNAVATDTTGNHPNSTIDAPTFTAVADRFGNATGAVHFQSTPGSATYLQIAEHTMPLSALPRALSLWVRPTTAAAKSPGAKGPHSNVFVQWGIDGCTGKMFGIGFPSGKALGFVGCNDLDSPFALPVGTWSFVLLNYDSGTLTLVVDKQRKSKVVSLATASGAFTIGGERRNYNDGVVYYFDGDIDDVRVWDRVLNDAEIAALEADR